MNVYTWRLECSCSCFLLELFGDVNFGFLLGNVILVIGWFQLYLNYRQVDYVVPPPAWLTILNLYRFLLG